MAAEQLELEVGDQVDVWRPPGTKDESGWRGPATVVDTRQPVTVRWQGRHMQVRTQDLRRALGYFICLTRALPMGADPVDVLVTFADSLQSDVIRLG